MTLIALAATRAFGSIGDRVSGADQGGTGLDQREATGTIGASCLSGKSRRHGQKRKPNMAHGAKM